MSDDELLDRARSIGDVTGDIATDRERIRKLFRLQFIFRREGLPPSRLIDARIAVLTEAVRAAKRAEDAELSVAEIIEENLARIASGRAQLAWLDELIAVLRADTRHDPVDISLALEIRARVQDRCHDEDVRKFWGDMADRLRNG